MEKGYYFVNEALDRLLVIVALNMVYFLIDLKCGFMIYIASGNRISRFCTAIISSK